jgi:hypothetical protein
MIHQRRPLIAATEQNNKKEEEETLSSSSSSENRKEEESQESPLQLSFSSGENTRNEPEIVRMSAGKRDSPPNPHPEVGSSQPVLPTKTDPIIPATISPPPARRKRVSILVFSRFFTFVQSYSEILTKNFPKSIKNVFQVFSVGLKVSELTSHKGAGVVLINSYYFLQDFIREMIEYGRISKRVLLAANGARDLSGKELDIYYRMPKEMLRVAPTLLISSLPLMHNIMFLVA